MTNPIFLEELARTHQRDRMKEAEDWRNSVRAMRSKVDKLNRIQRLWKYVRNLQLQSTKNTIGILTRTN